MLRSETMESADWSELPTDLLLLVYEKLNKFVDHARFSQVCKSWRSALSKNGNHDHPHLPQPPLMLVFNNNTLTEPSTITSCNPSTVFKLQLPEFHEKRIVGSIGNWVITVDTKQMIRLTNPFIAAEILLPPQSAFKSSERLIGTTQWTPEQLRDRFLCKVVLSSSPSSSRDVIALAFSNYNRVAFARPGDGAWKIVRPVHPYEYLWPVHDAIFYKEKFYVMEHMGYLYEFDINTIHRPRLINVIDHYSEESWASENSFYGSKCYSVELMGELILVLRSCKMMETNEIRRETEKFDVFKADFTAMEWVRVKSLGSHSLFLGLNTSVSLMASDFDSCAFRKNCIYFTNDTEPYFTNYTEHFEGPSWYDMGVFNMEDGRIEPIHRGFADHSVISSSIWIIPRSIII